MQAQWNERKATNFSLLMRRDEVEVSCLPLRRVTVLVRNRLRKERPTLKVKMDPFSVHSTAFSATVT